MPDLRGDGDGVSLVERPDVIESLARPPAGADSETWQRWGAELAAAVVDTLAGAAHVGCGVRSGVSVSGTRGGP
jgi:hypothetical protein